MLLIGRGGSCCSSVFGRFRRGPQYLPGGPSPPGPHAAGWPDLPVAGWPAGSVPDPMLLLLVGLRLISPWPAVFARGAEAPGPPRCWVAGSPRCWLAGGERPGPRAAARRSSADFAVARSICPGGRAPGPPRCWVAGSSRCWLVGGERPGPRAAARWPSADFAVARSICPGGRAPRTPALLGGRISPLLVGRRGG